MLQIVDLCCEATRILEDKLLRSFFAVLEPASEQKQDKFLLNTYITTENYK